ncbi:Galectin-4 [Camelus dromedarius]|uniref:Galectin n=1 Tax=Camelus dromedarius TaxID=9838 RepID=A0A5N4DQH3_CAMDR|nr:Galectin-4 [Camelus dromedarius]
MQVMTIQNGSGYKSHLPLAISHHSPLLELFSQEEPPAQPLEMAFVPAPGYQPTYNPTLPYHNPIPGGLRVGMSVYIQGMASQHMKRFSVNFVVGQGPGADVAFHFNPRFDGWDKVVFNTQQDGKWGKEERKMSMPFSKGAAFELVFMILPEHYKVVVNGNPFYEYGHRLPVQTVTHLQPPMPNPTYPGPGQYHQQSRSLPTMEGPPAFNPVCFVINFKVGSSGDLALHINPRLNEGVVVRNSRLKGSWGPEERKLSYNPFGPGQFFDLSIRCGMDRFKVYANGQHLFDFSHRLSAFQTVDMVEIQGDVTLSYVQI